MPKVVVGIDGGGTKTQAMLMDERGVALGSGLGGPSNYDDIGVEATAANIAVAVQAACQAAGIEQRSFDAAFLGLAGVVSATDHAIIRQIAQQLELAASDAIQVDHDCRIALAGGLSGRPGIAQIAGTGASTYGRTADGREWRSGGWGHLLSDEGSSYWFGIEAIKVALRCYDGRQAPSQLYTQVMQSFELSDINEIMHRFYVKGLSRSEIASLAPLVIEAAQENDGAALDLIKAGMEQIAECVEAVARKLGFEQAESELALIGGLFRAGPVVIDPLQDAVSARLPKCRLLLAERDPVVGACLLALQGLDRSTTPI